MATETALTAPTRFVEADDTRESGFGRTHEAQDERGRASVGPPLGRPNILLAADRPHRGCEEWVVEGL
jgi:hypothetical protein